MKILCLDVGTMETGYCLIEDYIPLEFGKTGNSAVMDIVKAGDYDVMVYEEFRSYGMAVGESTITSITWNGRFIQAALERGKKVSFVFRSEEKMNLCKSMTAKDSNIRQALIDRFAKHDFKSGKGTKKNPDFFYGFAKDMWSAFAVGVTWADENVTECPCDKCIPEIGCRYGCNKWKEYEKRIRGTDLRMLR